MFVDLNANHQLGITVGALSSLFWTIAYALIALRGFKDKTFGMPLAALAANLSWEVLFVGRTIIYGHWDVRLALLIPWTLLDFLIAYQCWRFGAKDFRNPLIRTYFRPAFILILITGAGMIGICVHEFEDSLGWYTAYGQNLMMSVLFVAMILRRNNLEGQSIYIALSKFAGTFFAFVLALFWSPATLNAVWPSLMPDAYYPISPFIVVVYAGIFIFDVTYIGLVWLQSRERGESVWLRF